MAVKLGKANVDALGRSLTAKQFVAWEAYERLEPFDERRADYRAASICAVIANVNRGKGQKAYTVEDFLLKFGEQEPKKRQTPEEQFQIMKIMAAAYSEDAPQSVAVAEAKEDAAVSANMREQVLKARAAMKQV